MIHNSNLSKFDENKWISFNDLNFNYGKCSTCSDNLNLDLFEKTNGFLTEYSKSLPSEDMAEIFSFLMINESMVKNKIKNDEILTNNEYILVDRGDLSTDVGLEKVTIFQNYIIGSLLP